MPSVMRRWDICFVAVGLAVRLGCFKTLDIGFQFFDLAPLLADDVTQIMQFLLLVGDRHFQIGYSLIIAHVIASRVDVNTPASASKTARVPR